jgi:hypothetical protein
MVARMLIETGKSFLVLFFKKERPFFLLAPDEARRPNPSQHVEHIQQNDDGYGNAKEP